MIVVMELPSRTTVSITSGLKYYFRNTIITQVITDVAKLSMHTTNQNLERVSFCPLFCRASMVYGHTSGSYVQAGKE